MMREAPRALLAAAFAALGLFSLFFFLRDRGQTDFLFFFLTTTVTAVFIVSWLSVWAVFGLPLTFLFRIGHAGVFVLPALAWVLFLKFFERPIGRLHRALLAVQAAGRWRASSGRGPTTSTTRSRSAASSARPPRPTSSRISASGAAARPARAAAPRRGARGGPGGGVRLRRPPRPRRRASIDIALSGPAFFVLMSVLLAALADRLARLRLAASTDPLTSLANRAVLFDRIRLEIARARRSAHPVALAILDLDGFKGFNDRYGHVAGDRLLVAAAAAITQAIRDTDLAARFGGDEFVVLLPEADATRAVSCLERIRSGIGRARISGTRDGTTVSAGVAVFDPNVRASVSVSAWLRQADAALYAAKAAGRDRVLVAHGAPPGAASGDRVPSDDASIRRVPGSSP
jgi:diguanylate cyclase (GGDEF) domain